MNEKINPDHLKRVAYVYVRQSTAHQVRYHTEDRQRQYELTNLARQMGFAKVVVIDDDQGRSGSGLVDRPGFGELLAAICRGEVGAVFALEGARLARNNREWHHLIDLCALTEAVIIDTDGVYDPRLLNDRLLLGLKGTMNEFELALFRQRAREAFERKISRGHALWELPVGFVRNEDDRVEKIADRQIQQAIERVFRRFRELGSVRQTAIWYAQQEICLPRAQPGTKGKEVVWCHAKESRVHQIVTNPCYAGALAYGRTTAKTTVQNGRARKSSTRQKRPREQWTTLTLDNHQGYISWEEYLENQRIIETNTAMRQGTNTGAAKGGPALLAGLLRCGRCGRRLFVAYSGKGGRRPRYACRGGRTERGSSSCLSIGGWRVDQVVSREVVEAIQPAGIKAALASMEEVAGAKDQKREFLQLALEKARYEARRIQRQYDLVDPENRLVAGELETRWNESLAQVDRLEQQLTTLGTERIHLTEEQRRTAMELGNDLSQLWAHAAAPIELKKRIARTVIQEIVIDSDDEAQEHVLVIHWQGGVHTKLRVPRTRPGQRPQTTSRDAIDLIRELSKVCDDQAIAATLNRLGYRTGAGKTWRVHSVHNARYYHRLPNYRQGKEWLTISQAAKESGVSQTVIRRLIRQKKLPANQVVALAPWIVHRPDLSSPVVKAEIEAVRRGRQLPRHSPNQHELPLK